MISLKIKTLDSQDHDFTVEDDITVRQFKEHIAANTGISADVQRLIYCGRVLNDEKHLREYDVNGKVVHLVERAPPRAQRPGDSTSNTPSSSQNNHRSNIEGDIFRRTLGLDGMVVGAMAIPMGSNSTTHSLATSVSPASTLCINRIAAARHMLECANNIVSYLEQPERGLNNTEMIAQQTLESTVFELGISAVSDVEVPQQEVQNIVSALQGVVSAAIRQNDIELATSGGTNETGGGTNETGGSPTLLFGGNAAPLIMQVPPPHPPSAFMHPQAEMEMGSVRLTVPNMSQNFASSPASGTDDDSGSGTATGTQSGPSATNGNATSASTSRNHTTSPQVLAEVVEQMRTVNTRLEPYIQQYYDLLLNDPVFEESDTTGRENAQRLFDRVSEALHYMSHALHAISDLMFNLTLATPRHLCCRPILVEQNAIVSSGFAMPNIRRQDTNTNNFDSTAANNNTARATSPTMPTMPTMPTTPAPATTVQSEGNIEIDPIASSTPPTQTTQSNFSFVSAVRNGTVAAAIHGANRQVHVARLMQAVVNSVPMYADVHVQMNSGFGAEPSNLTINSQSTQSSSTDSQTSNSENNVATPVNNGAEQPRVTTATHPTTSTQTRSTARPLLASIPATHMHNIRPMTIQLSSFDRFLPCNSHHVRENTQRNGRSQHIRVSHPRREMIRRRVSFQRLPRDARILLEDNISNSDVPIRLFGCEIPIRELINLTPSPAIFNRIRADLRAYVVQRFGTPPDMSEPFAHILNLLNESSLSTSFHHPNYNALHSVNNLIHHTLPAVVNLILNDDSDQFGVRILRTLNEFIKRLFVILMIVGDFSPAKQFLSEMIIMGLDTNRRGVVRAFQSRIIAAISRRLQSEERRLQSEEIVLNEVQQFLVIHMQGPSASNSSPQPMETDDVIPTTSSDEQMVDEIPPQIENSVVVETTVTPPIDADPLPNVVVGSESWHNGLPTNWLPIITRDLQRQRRQSPQGPYSDAYLCGMSSKRRKLISNTKPSGNNPSQLLTETMRHVIQSQSNANSIMLTTEEGLEAHSHIQEPYGSFEQAIRTNIQKRIESDPDFNPERYPNCSKWMNLKK